MITIKQSSATQSLVFLMIDSSDHISGKTGLTPTVTLCKNGDTLAPPAGAVSEIGSGLYKVAPNATDSNTLGSLILHATASGADPADKEFMVVAFDPLDAVRVGLTALPNANAEAAGGLFTRGTGVGQINQPGNGQIDANFVQITGSADRTIAITTILDDYSTDGTFNATLAGNITGKVLGSGPAAIQGVGARVEADGDSIDPDDFADAVWTRGDRTLTQSPPVAQPAQQYRSRSIVRGNSYGVGGRAFAITQASGAEWPGTLSDYTWSLTATKDPDNGNDGSDSFTGAASISGSSLVVALSAETTAAAAPGQYRFGVRGVGVSDTSNVWTVELGVLNVCDDPAVVAA